MFCFFFFATVAVRISGGWEEIANRFGFLPKMDGIWAFFMQIRRKNAGNAIFFGKLRGSSSENSRYICQQIHPGLDLKTIYKFLFLTLVERFGINAGATSNLNLLTTGRNQNELVAFCVCSSIDILDVLVRLHVGDDNGEFPVRSQ